MSQTDTTRRPRIALMGEFSAGKSTLANLLLGQTVSPVKVTATQLPPVWYSFGAESVLRVDNTGQATALPPEALNDISHQDTQAVRVLLEAEVLEFCDVIDMPGTSDPNMPSEIWQRVLDRADGVVWCTPSTQAWRQSEAALWEQMPARLHAHSLLLITRMDALSSDADRARVTARVQRETEGLFRQVLPISLIEALSDPDNPEVLDRSGAERFVENLVELVETLGAPRSDGGPILFEPLGTAAPEPAPEAAAPALAPDGVVPRRVVPKRIRRAAASARPA